MDLYTRVSYQISRYLTEQYSTSFSMSSRLFSRTFSPHIYAIYGLVRIADEIVDTYDGPEKRMLLGELERETYRAMSSGYSANPIVQAFAVTANAHDIPVSLVKPFFASMRMDITKKTHTKASYRKYIYGSAEVVGLMCLKVFCVDKPELYQELKTGAQTLGSAYQKINFLRDIGADAKELGRWYFPEGSYKTFSNNLKQRIETEIADEFDQAHTYITKLPAGSRKAVYASYIYYRLLEDEIRTKSAKQLKEKRIRVSNSKKLSIFIKLYMKPERQIR